MAQWSLCLSLLLTCLPGISASEREQDMTSGETLPYGPSSVVISGASIVTVGVPYGFECTADCSPPCNFTWTWLNQVKQGPNLRLKLSTLVPQQVLTCEAFNPETAGSGTAQTILQVTAGPSNIQITGPSMLSSGVASTFTCNAYCYPSCSYTWFVSSQNQIPVVTSGNTTMVTAPSWARSMTVTCEATDTVSGLFISTSTTTWIAQGPGDVYISGPSTVTAGQQYQFVCNLGISCTPNCDFTWIYLGQRLSGDQVTLPILHHGDIPQVINRLEITVDGNTKTETLTCEVQNTVSGLIASDTDTLTVIDPMSVSPVTTAPPISGLPFSLQCLGSQNPASIVWLKNYLPIPESEHINLSPENITLSFDPLLPSDDGIYQCVVDQGGLINSTGYQMKVNFGPLNVVISQPNKGPVGKEINVLPGSSTLMNCSAECYPQCSYTWTYNSKIVAFNTPFLFKPETPPYQGPLTCRAYNPVTKDNSSAETSVVLLDGPSNVQISGPDALEVGVKASFRCTALCSPSCSYTWNVYGREMTGNVIDITVSRYVATESLSCEAHNTVTGNTATVNETLRVTDPHWCGC